jgi:predicted CXXCH cytochrome family protein
MMKRALGAPSHMSGATVAVCAALFIGCATAPTYAAERVVLCEEFTETYCGACQFAGPALDELLSVYPDTLAFVQYHIGDYSTPWSDTRFGFYNGYGTPTAAFDGVDRVESSVPDIDLQYAIYRTTHFLPEAAFDSDVTLSIQAVPLGATVYHATAQVAIEAGGTAKTMRVYILQLLDHFPPEHDYYRNSFKQAAPTVDISLQPGQTQTVQVDFELDEDSSAALQNVKFMAWVQQPVDIYPAPVYQAAVRGWPFAPLPGDEDADGVPDVIDNCPHRYNPDQLDSDGDGIGDACDNCRLVYNPDQVNADGDVFGDACDLCPAVHSQDPNDTDSDGIGNPCDSCPEVPAPAGVDAFGRSRGCIDLDCDVDQDDYELLQLAWGGPGITTPPGGVTPDIFADANVDGDGDVDLADFAVFQINFTGPLPSPALYVGVDNCLVCHADQHALWTGTLHAGAMQTLLDSGTSDLVSCFPCHTVGFGKPSGFVDLEKTPQLANVQCEVCHGPGSNHVADPVLFPLVKDYESAMCGACHESCHGLCGTNEHPQYEQWSHTKHATALVDIQFGPDTVDACLQCHSTEYRLAPPDQKPTVWTVIYDIECVACHNPHGSPNLGQLRLPVNQICADCHTMSGLYVGAAPARPQSEMLHSLGGVHIDGTPITQPYTQHWWGIADECAVCHVHMEPSPGPGMPSNSGHSFLENMRACLPCHSESVATALVANMREEIDWRVNAIAPYFNPDDPLYIDPGTLDPDTLVQYMFAQFDYDMVANDRSHGSHNPNYARALLSVTENFLGIPPWEVRTPGLQPAQPATSLDEPTSLEVSR